MIHIILIYSAKQSLNGSYIHTMAEVTWWPCKTEAIHMNLFSKVAVEEYIMNLEHYVLKHDEH